MEYVRLRGTGVSPGVAIGNVLLMERVIFSSIKETISSDRIEKEIERLNKAVERTKKDLTKIKDSVKKKIGEDHSFIFESHLFILQDKSLVPNLEKSIRKEKVRSEWAISQVHNKYMKIFESLTDDYFRQRKDDVTDVLSKLYMNLESSRKKVRDDGSSKVLVGHDLLPSEAALRLSQGNILAVALDMGGQTSHTAILARSMNIPAVLGLSQITKKVKNGDRIIVDGTDGDVIINPPLGIRKEFEEKRERYNNYRRELQKTAVLSSATLDGTKFTPLANIELPEEVKNALALGAEGIGLFRSEFIYFQKTSLPSVEDHFLAYNKIAEEANPAPVYIRTVDIGGEKNLPQLNIEKEPNPALGLRAIRFSLSDRELFRIQLRAILRASVLKNVRILIPMITEIEEIEEVKQLLHSVKDELRSKKIPFDENIPLGAMIEVPAAAAITDLLVKDLDFLSIGTNDLIQYYLAVDRTNELVSYLFKPLHPSVLRLLRFVIETANKAGKEITVCGEMAADPLSAIVLLGLGVRNFSMNPIFIPRIKKAFRSVDARTVKKIVHKAMELRTAQEIEEFIIEQILVNHPEAFLMSGTH
ncbi:MAG: phosphoenolpyruvate--protein phosphotransferase [Candidatus Aminicenantes bacterium]|nr:phosphoenolpyruvate--protein phosphotransferase [Candidatus Aminicenantes bacterium]